MKRNLETLKRTLARNIVGRRQELRLSQEQLALQAEVDRTYISQIERAVGNPSLLVLHKVAAVLEVDVTTLLRPDGEKAEM
ncbi:MAG: helix-turn-helix domain-containing protein [Burkholderiales bacterium]|jgi:transcriptional regulator with XRE-family HTH domain|nr:helix-turn-helix domain-containing protein [Burkholderiales bacterium]